MKFRSWLVVPGDSEKRLGTAMAAAADVVVVDLADTVAPDRRADARRLGCEWLAAHRTTLQGQRRIGRWVRINALETGQSREDLAAVMAAAPDGIILPCASGPDAVGLLASEIYELERQHGLPVNSTQILPVVGETAHSAMRIADYREAPHQRVHGLTWSAKGLSARLGATSVRVTASGWSDTCRFVRAQTLLSAHASNIMAIDAPFENLDDEAGLAEAAARARAEGFAGVFAVHPGQVAAINAAYMPVEEELAQARAIIAAFAESPHLGSQICGGRMVDRADLDLAQRVVALHDGGDQSDAGRLTAMLRPA